MRPRPEVTYEPFAAWKDLLVFIAAGGELYYQAPLDVRAHRVRVVCVFKNGKVRLDPDSSGADPFTADAGHLDRMRRRVA